VRKKIIYSSVCFVAFSIVVIIGFLKSNHISPNIAVVTGNDSKNRMVPAYKTGKASNEMNQDKSEMQFLPPVRLQNPGGNIDKFLDVELQKVGDKLEEERIKEILDRTDPVTYHALYATCKIGKIYRNRIDYQSWVTQNSTWLEQLWSEAKQIPPDSIIRVAKEYIGKFWDKGGLLGETSYQDLYAALFVMDKALQSKTNQFLYGYWKTQILLSLHPYQVVTDDVDHMTAGTMLKIFPINFQGCGEARDSLLECYAALKKMDYPAQNNPAMSAYARDILYEIIETPILAGREKMPTPQVRLLRIESFELLKKHGNQYPELKMYIDALDLALEKYKKANGNIMLDLPTILLSQYVYDNYENPADGSREITYKTWGFMSPIIRTPMSGWKNLIELAKWDELPYPGKEGRWIDTTRVEFNTEKTEFVIQSIRKENENWKGCN